MSTCPTPNKRGHTTKARAKAHLGSLWKNGRGSVDYNAYLCRCGLWHIGHKPGSLAKRIHHALRKGHR